MLFSFYIRRKESLSFGSIRVTRVVIQMNIKVGVKHRIPTMMTGDRTYLGVMIHVRMNICNIHVNNMKYMYDVHTCIHVCVEIVHVMHCTVQCSFRGQRCYPNPSGDIKASGRRKKWSRPLSKEQAREMRRTLVCCYSSRSFVFPAAASTTISIALSPSLVSSFAWRLAFNLSTTLLLIACTIPPS